MLVTDFTVRATSIYKSARSVPNVRRAICATRTVTFSTWKDRQSEAKLADVHDCQDPGGSLNARQGRLLALIDSF